jgi:hypothetical protein
MAKSKKAAATKTSESGPKHQWVKVTTVQQKDKSGLFLLFRCTQCDLTYKRRSDKWNPPAGACKPKKLAKPSRFKATLEEAKKRTAEVKEKFAVMGKLWWELGAEVKKCIDDFVPEALGRKATEWMKDCFGDSWLKIYRAHRAISALPGVAKEKLEKISEGNAYQLARLPEKIRKADEWLDKAAKLNNEVFKEIVEKQREKKGIKRDPMVKFMEIFGCNSVPKTLAATMKQALKLAGEAEQVDMDTKEGRITAIECIFSEFITSQATEEEQAAAMAKANGPQAEA